MLTSVASALGGTAWRRRGLGRHQQHPRRQRRRAGAVEPHLLEGAEAQVEQRRRRLGPPAQRGDRLAGCLRPRRARRAVGQTPAELPHRQPLLLQCADQFQQRGAVMAGQLDRLIGLPALGPVLRRRADVPDEIAAGADGDPGNRLGRRQRLGHRRVHPALRLGRIGGGDLRPQRGIELVRMRHHGRGLAEPQQGLGTRRGRGQHQPGGQQQAPRASRVGARRVGARRAGASRVGTNGISTHHDALRLNGGGAACPQPNSPATA